MKKRNRVKQEQRTNIGIKNVESKEEKREKDFINNEAINVIDYLDIDVKNR